MSEHPESEDYLSRGLSSVIRRQRARADGEQRPSLLDACDSDVKSVTEPMPTELAGRTVVDLIARGGVGLVYRVSDRELGRELAVKVLSRSYAQDAEMVERFEAEARVCAQLQHPGIVPIHDAGRLPDGRPFFTMKVVEGDTLGALLAARDEPAVRDEPATHRRRFVEVFERVCQTLAYVHAKGVVHGDLKPSNVMVGAFGEVQVMDWGFAREVDLESTVHPDRSIPHILGTPAYMAPEQARGDELAITSRTDVFGLGAILCEILTGRPPYAGETKSVTYLQATQCWQDDVREALHDCGGDAALVALASRCLDPDAQQRPHDATDVAREVTGYLEGLETRARELQLKAVAAEARATQERRSRRIVLALGAALLAAVIAVAGTLVWLQHERSSREAETHRLLAELVERGRSLAERARASDTRQLLYWDEAQTALTQAQHLAGTRDASGQDRAVVAQLLDSIQVEARAAQRQHSLVQWAERMRPHYTDDRNAATVARGYRAGFARFGFTFAEQPDAAVEQIQASPVADVLCAAVDDWARVARNRDHGELHGRDIDWRALVDIARRADPHPFRDRLRVAFRDDQLDELLSLVGAEELRTASPATRNLLGKCLFDLGASEQAIEVLRVASVAYPRDFWILHDLAVFLRRQPDASTHEILGLCRAAVAVRPSDPHALSDFAHALAFLQDRPGAAGVVLERVHALTPSYTRSWFPELLVLNGRFDEALALARTNAERSPGDAVALRVLGWTAHIQGQPNVSVSALRKVCELRPGEPGPQLELASALADLGQLDGARTAALTARQHTARAASGHRWTRCDEVLAAALLRTKDPASLAAVDGWPDLIRGTANHLLGNEVRAAEELRDWFDSDPEDADHLHFVIAARASLAAARATDDREATTRWQLQAARFLRAAVAVCVEQSEVPATRRGALITLRWLQGDPVMKSGPWLGDAAIEFENLQQSMRTLAKRLVGT